MQAPVVSASARIDRLDLPPLRNALAALLLEYRAHREQPIEPNPEAWVLRLFALLGWDAEQPARCNPLAELEGASIHTCELFGYDAFELVVLWRRDELSWPERTEAALTWLYNRGTEWAVVSDFESLEIVNVRWTDKARSFIPFRRLESAEYVEEADTLSLLTPWRIHHRDLYQQGIAEQPRKDFEKANVGELTVRPHVTEAILATVLESRNRFLSTPPAGEVDAEEYDHQIHQLLLRLIFVRACEDMGLDVARPLRDLLTEDDIYVALADALEKYQALYESELFQPLDLTRFDEGSLRHALRTLYVRAEMIRFNFSAIEADILGLIYEEYLKYRAVRKMRDGENEDQAYIFTLERIGTENIKRKQGIYYTPSFIVEAMVEQAFALLGAPNGWIEGRRPAVVADLACGSGTFLASAFRWIESRPSSYQQAATTLRQSILGIDSDARAVEATRLNLWLMLFRLHPEVHPLPFLSSAIFARDSLVGPLLPDTGLQGDILDRETGGCFDTKRLPTRPDLILGNPPFVAIERQTAAYRETLQREGFESLTHRADLANLFVERALDTVKDGGIVALVVPNRIFSTQSAAALRSIIHERADVELVIDFGTEQVFAATTYVSVVFLRRRTRPRKQAGELNVVQVKRLHEPRGLQLREALLAPEPPAGVERLRVRMPAGEAPIFFVPRRATTLLEKLRTRGVSLSAIARTPQGIKVGDQSLYVVQELNGFADPGEGLIRVTPFKDTASTGKPVILERAALKPAVHSKFVQRYTQPPFGYWIIYPYAADGNLIPFEEYADRFPLTAGYLHGHLDKLRERARTTNSTWHKLAEPRDEEWLGAEKVLVPQLARGGRMTLDEKGLYLIQGFGIVPKQGSLLDSRALLGILNSTLLVWATAMSSPRYRGDSFEYQGNILGALPIPRLLLESASMALEISDTANELFRAYNAPGAEFSETRLAKLEADVDAMVYAAAELTASEVQFVEDEAAPYRPAFSMQSTREAIALLLIPQEA